jgi:hypothetical protein
MEHVKIDPLAETVAIPVKIVRGKVTYLYKGGLPKFKDGVIGHLILPKYAVTSQDWVAPLQAEVSVGLLAAGQEILLGMNERRIPRQLIAETTEIPFSEHGDLSALLDYRFVSLELISLLDLVLRGSKKAVLRGRRCTSAAFEEYAGSLNHAYSLCSAKYEPDRLGHTGNAFFKAFYKEGDGWWPLERLRVRHEADYEQKVLMVNKRLPGRRPSADAVDQSEPSIVASDPVLDF